MLESFIDINIGFWGGSLITAFMLIVIVPWFIKRKEEKKAIRRKAEAIVDRLEKEGKIKYE